jgi:hypothetical protein
MLVLCSCCRSVYNTGTLITAAVAINVEMIVLVLSKVDYEIKYSKNETETTEVTIPYIKNCRGQIAFSTCCVRTYELFSRSHQKQP